MTMPHETSCPEFASATMSRRGLFRGAALGAGALASTSVFGSAFVETSYGATRTAPAVLVVLSMRGAVDGMSLVVPHGDPTYYAARPRIAVPTDALLAKDGFFGLHPKLKPLLPLWNKGAMAAVHATGMRVPNRSHFSAMESVEDADPGTSARIGWLNRLIARDSYANPLRAIQVGDKVPPTSLYGPRPAIGLSDIDSFRLAGDDQWDKNNARPRSLHTIWDKAPGPLGVGARSAMQAVTDFGPVRATSTTPGGGATYPRGDLGAALAAAARTIRGDVGAEVITVDHGSWDHHNGLGTLEWGEMTRMADTFASALAAFFTDLGPLASKVTLVTLSEFGRRTKENANYGLDHGHGNVMLLLGAGVKGGYYGTWTPLTNDTNADLLVTTDYRSVLSEVVVSRMGASSAKTFPGLTPEHVGAVTSL